MVNNDKVMPLEANPEPFNNLAQKLGLDTSQFCIHDILGFDDDLLALVPRPVKAAILLYPTPAPFDHPANIAAEKEIEKRWGAVSEDVRKEMVFIRQRPRLSNHCGTMVKIHKLTSAPFNLIKTVISLIFFFLKGSAS